MAWSSSKTDVFTQGDAPSLPAAKGTFNDPVFDTQIIRVTDNSFPASGNHTHSYSYWPAFNADNTRLLTNKGDGGAWMIGFNPNTNMVGSATSMATGILSYEYCFFWSYLDPDKGFGTSGSNFRVYDAVNNNWTTLWGYSGHTIGSGGKNFVHLTLSADDRVAAFKITTSGVDWGFAAIDTTNGDVLYYNNYGSFDELQVDKTGRYLVVKNNQQGAGQVKVRVVDLEAEGGAAIIHELISDDPPYPYGHSDLGSGNWFGYDNWNDTVGVIDLAAATATTFVNNGWGSTYDMAETHFSMFAEPWGLMGSYGTVRNRVFNNEIAFINIETNEWRRFVKHFVIEPEYYASPRPVVSHDGKYVVFTSNWGDSGRYDVFIAVVPEDMGIWDSEEPPVDPPAIGTPIMIGGVPLLFGGVPCVFGEAESE